MIKKVLLALLTLHQLSAQETFVLPEQGFQSSDLNPSSLYFYEKGSNLSFEKIQKEHFETFAKNVVSEPFKTVWVKLKLENSSDSKTICKLKLFEEWCEKVEVYSRPIASKDSWKIQLAGMMYPLDSLGSVIKNDKLVLLNRPDQVAVSLEPHETREYYIKFTKVYRPFLKIDLRLLSILESANLQVKESKDNWVTAAFMAMIAVLSLFNLLYFFILRDEAYLYYSLYGFSVIFAATVMDKYCLFMYQLFYQNNTFIQPWVYVFAGVLSPALYTQFSRSFLQTKKRFPRLDKILVFLIFWILFTTLLSGINFIQTGRQFMPNIPFSSFMVLLGLLYVVQVIMVLKSKEVHDKFLLAGIGILLLCILPNYVYELFHPDSIYGTPSFMGSFSFLQLGTVLEMVIFALGLGFRTRQLKKDKQHFEDLDALKSNFFTNISHEFRTPLMLIKGPLEQLRKKMESKADINLVDLAQSNSDRLLSMINQILDLSKLDANKMKLDRKLVNVVPALKSMFYSFESLALKKGITLNFETSEDVLEMAVDMQKMETIFVNLIFNAIKYSDKQGLIIFQISKQKQHVFFNVIDTGNGIATEDIGNIFDRFYQKDISSQENTNFGIGLALVKELVLLHKGQISVKSKVGKGSTFEVKLPLITAGFEKETDLHEINTGHLTEFIIESAEEHIAQEYSLLLIEDNLEVRSFIKSQLLKKYKVAEAENGTEGIKIAKKIQPDLIISDVMMPGKNGYEVTSILKNDIKTSHIPIILLTAKANQTEKMEGLDMGADAYLTKPFSQDELEVRIDNLIKLRKELRTRFAGTVQIKPTEVSVNSVDQEFIEKLMAIVEENIPNEDFSVAILAKEIGISSPHLNRKLRSLISQSTNEFIQSVRLERAAELLQKKTGNVSEIAFQTGFGSTAYFVSTFKKRFGMPPGEYKKQF